MRGSRGDGPSRFYLHSLERGEPIHQGVYDMTEKIRWLPTSPDQSVYWPVFSSGFYQFRGLSVQILQVNKANPLRKRRRRK